MALKVGELYALFTLDQSGVDSAITSIERKLNGMSTTFTRTGTILTNAMTRPLVDFGKDSVKTAMDYGGQMSQALSRFSGLDTTTAEGAEEFAEAYAAIDAEVMRVAKDSIYTTSEVAGAVEKMGMAGWSWQASVAAIEPLMDLAAASGEDVVTVSDIVTDAMTAFGLTFENAGKDMETFNGMVEHFSNVLATAATASNTDIGMMGESFKYAASMAGSMGYSVDDVAMALGLMANRGVKASQAGTSLRRLLTNMLNPKGDAEGVMNSLYLSLTDEAGNLLELGQVMDQLREKFADGAGSMAAYGDAIKGVQQEYNFNDWIDQYDEYSEKYDAAMNKGDTAAAEALQKEYADVLATWDAYSAACNDVYEKFKAENDGKFGIIQNAVSLGGARGMQALLAIINSSEEEYTQLRKAIEGSDTYGNGQGRTHAMKETMLDNAQGSLTRFTSSVNVLKTEIGDLINESLVPMIDKAKEIVDNFIGMDDETKKSVMDVVGLVAAMGPALVGLGLMTSLLPKLATAFSFLSSPLGIIIALFGAMAFSAMDAEGNISKGMEGIAEALGIDTSGLDFENFDLTEKLNGMLEGVTNFADSPVFTGFMEKMGDGLRGAIAKVGSLDGGELVKTLIGTITGLANSEGVQTFMGALGDGIKGTLSALGNIAGSIIGYILSPEGLGDIWDAGVSIAGLLLGGIGSAISGVGSFIEQLILNMAKPLTDWIDKTLRDAGLLSDEDMVPELSVGDQDIDLGFVQLAEGAEGDMEKARQLLHAALAKYALDPNDPFFGQAYANLGGVLNQAGYKYGSDTNAFLNGIWGAVLTRDGALGNAEKIKEIFKEKFGEIGLDDELLSVIGDEFFGQLAGLTAEDLRGEGDPAKMQAIYEALVASLFPPQTEAEAAEEAGSAAEAAKEAAVQAVVDELNKDVPETVEAGSMGIEGIAQTASNQATAGMEKAMTESAGPVGEAAATVSDAAVQQFLLVMSEENGATIANSFIGGIVSVLNTHETVTAPAQSLSEAVRNAATSAMKWLDGYNIGYNFGLGILRGIEAMIQSVANAAAAMGDAATGSLSAAIDEGSPSRITEETGTNFGLGFINAIWDSVAGVQSAAVTMGRTAASSLKDGLGSISGSAAAQMNIETGNRKSQAEALADENSKTAETYAGAIARALSGARVMMNGELVGQLVTDTVSEEIASRYVGKRYGTV